MFKEKFTAEKMCKLALLIALQVVLARFISINAMGVRIGFSFVPVMVAAYLYGPLSAGAVSALADLIGVFLFPTGPYHPGFTVIAFAMGVVSGLLLDMNCGVGAKYWGKVVLSVVINNLILGLFVNSLWLSQLYGSKTYGGWVVYRLTEYAVMVPIQIALAPVVRKIALTLEKLRR